MKTWIATLCALITLGTLAFTWQDKQPPAAPAPAAAPELTPEQEAAIVKAQKPSYPLTSCVVSGEALGSMGDPIELVVEGRLVRLCCKGCVKGVKKEPAKYLAKVDEGVIAAQKPSYPLTTCAVTGDPLEGADQVDMVVGTRLVRLCCNGCIKKVKKDPAATLAKVDAALIAQQIPTYPMDVCPISGHSLTQEGKPVDILYGTRLVRLCCNDCKEPFHKSPATALAKLDAAAAAKGAKK